MLMTEWKLEDAIAIEREEGFEEGIEKGCEEGREEGREVAQKEVINKLLRSMSEEQIAVILDMSVDEIKELLHK